MAKINENPLVRGARGNFGKQYVYRKRGNDTFLTRMPVKTDAPPSEKQEVQRDLFAAASQYATGAMNDPALKKAYGKKAPPGKTAYNMAFRDFLRAPKVRVIDTENYDGKPGSTIVVTARDDFRVVSVTVSIYSADGQLLEKGEAVLNPLYREKWSYTATLSNTLLTGSKIKVVARDLPGNPGMGEVTL
ncbi:hypothetical protein A3860_26940 [Niastella vici]|uniref:Uncharacterized protein n=1 Tax=Niastella vici TaxID=1703345 RepID=A0A1V9FWF1_9BACT|nr:hypothetical protein [Niastella vici]OQP62650.1 hypothetical protein A3860_26940 [Niastella vici]